MGFADPSDNLEVIVRLVQAGKHLMKAGRWVSRRRRGLAGDFVLGERRDAAQSEGGRCLGSGVEGGWARRESLPIPIPRAIPRLLAASAGWLVGRMADWLAGLLAPTSSWLTSSPGPQGPER